MLEYTEIKLKVYIETTVASYLVARPITVNLVCSMSKTEFIYNESSTSGAKGVLQPHIMDTCRPSGAW